MLDHASLAKKPEKREFSAHRPTETADSRDLARPAGVDKRNFACILRIFGQRNAVRHGSAAGGGPAPATDGAPQTNSPAPLPSRAGQGRGYRGYKVSRTAPWRPPGSRAGRRRDHAVRRYRAVAPLPPTREGCEEVAAIGNRRPWGSGPQVSLFRQPHWSDSSGPCRKARWALDFAPGRSYRNHHTHGAAYIACVRGRSSVG
jgi:hypothetical protein